MSLTPEIEKKVVEITQGADDFHPDPQFASITTPNELFASTIDHTLLKPDATPVAIDELCAQAMKYRFKSCCVNGSNVKRVSETLRNSSTITCAVIGFPLGAGTIEAKAFEAADAIKNGAKEIDMVINVGLLKSKHYDLVYEDITAVISASASYPVKVILETALLTKEEIIAGSFIAAEAGATFVKTCTGFGGGQAEVDHVRLMARTVRYKENVKVKASAGVRSFERCQEMYKAGAQRIGTSSGAAIMAALNIPEGTY